MKNFLLSSGILIALIGGIAHGIKIIWWDFPHVEASTYRNEQKIDKSYQLQCMMALDLMKNKEKIEKICNQ